MKRTLPFAKHVMKLVGARRSALDTAHGRLVLVSAFFALTYIMVAARLVDLSVIQGELVRGHEQTPPVDVAAAPQDVVRGDIVDRNGVLLATSLETASLYADPALIHDPEGVARAIVRVLPGLAYGDVLQKLQRKARFVWISRNLTPGEQYKILEIGEPGLDFRSEYRRIYPQGPLPVHMLGYTDLDGHGLAGIERSFDNFLADGNGPLRLTLDIRLQHILRRETVRTMQEFSGKGAAGVIMDVTNGDILAAVSLPDFDPHDLGGTPQKAFFNKLTLGVYELGSTFKIFSTAALLETQTTNLAHEFDARKPLKVGRFTISDYHAEKRYLTVPEVFMHSSNIGAALMGEMVGDERLQQFYSDLGLFTPLSLEIGEVGRPLYPHPWRSINTLTASYGHGVAVSPLQMVAAASTIIGGGTLIIPHLVLNNDDAAEKSQRRTDVRVVSDRTAHRMRQLTRLVVTDGTGTKADVPGYRVGGKTGTAEQPGPGGYSKKRLISSFLGFFPMDAPRYAVFIMVNEPQGTKESFGYATGGWVGAPAVGRVVAAMGPLLGIKPHDDVAGQGLEASLKQYVHEAKAEGSGQ